MEVKIAVCDDEQHQAEYVKSIVYKWADENNITADIYTFGSAEEFKNALKLNESKVFDILLLDIQMDGQSGVELAKELRLTDENLIIIFITALPDFVQDGYDVSALHYLMKPINTDKLHTVLDKAVKSLTKNNSSIFIPDDSDGGILRVLTDDIIYIESFDHYVEIRTIQKNYTVKMPMYELESKLGNNFKRCHRCYIVNLKYIKKITKTEITLDSNETISLSRRLYTEVNRAMIKYFTNEKDGKGMDK